MKKLNARDVYRLAKKLNLCLDCDGTTFYATDEKEEEIYAFDTKAERDRFVKEGTV